MGLALFDFDGTITDRDSFFDFLLFTFGMARCAAGAVVLGPMMALYLLKLVPNWKAKEAVFRHFLKGRSVVEFREAAERYAIERIPAIVRRVAVGRIEWHRSQGHRLMVVSASAEDWIAGWCGLHGMEVIATRLESRGGRLTGRIDGKNCNGPEKARRIRDLVDLGGHGRIYAYGNSGGDAEMMALADERYYNWERIA